MRKLVQLTDIDNNNLDPINSNYEKRLLTLENKQDIYSTNEVKTSKVWIDGKPIYRKVIDTTLTATNQEIAHNISNLDSVISLSGILYQGSYRYPIPYVCNLENYTVEMGMTGSNGFVYVKSGASITVNTKITIIIEYTKTTD